MAGEEFKVSLGVELNLDGLNEQLKNVQTSPIKIQIDTQNVQRQVQTIRRQLESLNSVKISPNIKTNNKSSKMGFDVNSLVNNVDLKLANDMSKLELSLSRISEKSAEVVSGMAQLGVAISNVQVAKNSTDVNHLVGEYKKYVEVLKNVKTQIDINSRTEKINNQSAKLQANKNSLMSEINIWLRNNSLAAKQFGTQIDELKSKLNSCDSVQFDGIKSEFRQITNEAKLAQNNVQTFGDRFKSQMSKLGVYFSASMVITGGIRLFRDVYENVVNVDTAMTGLHRVTNLTATQTTILFDNMVGAAKKYGATLLDVIDSTADWVKLGFDKNQAVQLAGITAMYQHITDLDNETAVENLVTAYKGFQTQLLNLYNGDDIAAIQYVADIFNELGKILPMKNYIG